MRDYYDFERYGRSYGAPVLTGEDWRLGRRPTGRTTRYRFVDTNTENRTKEEWPYSYSPYFLWGDAEKGCDAVYSDRLAQWDHEKARAALNAVADEDCRYGYWSQGGTSKYLTAYFGKPVQAVAVAEGCNVSSGYPYWIFWFRNAPFPPSDRLPPDWKQDQAETSRLPNRTPRKP